MDDKGRPLAIEEREVEALRRYLAYREKLIEQILGNHPKAARDQIIAELEAYGF
jgi:hypothetical protein